MRRIADRKRSSNVRRAADDYNHNAEPYMEVGNALGWAMADLLRRDKKSELGFGTMVMMSVLTARQETGECRCGWRPTVAV